MQAAVFIPWRDVRSYSHTISRKAKTAGKAQTLCRRFSSVHFTEGFASGSEGHGTYHSGLSSTLGRLLFQFVNGKTIDAVQGFFRGNLTEFLQIGEQLHQRIVVRQI